MIHFERNRAESYTIRVFSGENQYGDDWDFSLILDCTNLVCEVKAMKSWIDKRLNLSQRRELHEEIRKKAGDRKVYSLRHGKLIEY